MFKESLRIVPLFLAVALASCAGNGRWTPSAAPALSHALPERDGRASTKAYATVTISIPNVVGGSSARRRHRYVSPATQSVVIAVNSNAGPVKTFAANLTPASNPKCKASTDGVTCVLTLRLAKGHYTAAVSTYDGLLVHGRPTGNELSANQDIPFRVRANSVNLIGLSLGGVPTSVAFIPSSTSQLTGSVASGFTLPRCQPTAQRVSAFGIDADGNFILGAGAPSVVVRSGSASLTVTPPKPAAPNLFVLNPPSPPVYPVGGSPVYLEIQAVPITASGARPVFAIVKVTFSTDVCGVFTEFPIPTASSRPIGIAAGPDGAIWFTELLGSKIGRIPVTATAANPQITEYPTPSQSAGPEEIAAGPDGALWFTECYSGEIGRIPVGGSPILEFRVPSYGSPKGIAAGPDGAMWFAELNGNKIGRIPTNGLIAVTEYPIPTANSHPSGITAGPDGAMWFTEASGNKIGRIPTSGAPISEIAITTPNSSPRAIAAGPDGALWFTECLGENVGRIPSTSATGVEEFSPPTRAVGLDGITTGPDGAMWFVEAGASQIGRIAENGSITEYGLPVPGSEPRFIVVGSDGSLWFTEYNSNKIGRLQ